MNVIEHFITQAVTPYTFACWGDERQKRTGRTIYESPKRFPTEKKCTLCKQVKPVSEFALHKYFSIDWLQDKCRSCVSEYGRKYKERKREERKNSEMYSVS